MALLAVTSSTDFSLQVLLNITNVTFGTTRTTTATFDAGQFSATGIQSDVRWTADVHSNRIVVNGGSVDASNWIFSGWDQLSDRITLNGSAGDDFLTGSIVKETVNGRGGNDTFISVSNTQGDTFNGGTGNDEFLYLQGSPPVVDTLNGGTGSFDRIVIAGATSYDFRAATLSSIERFNFGAFDQVAQINASMLGSGGIIEIKGTASVNAMEIYGATNLDLGAAVNFTTWDSNLDTIRIEGTSGDDVITGTRKADVIVGLAGEDTLNGGRGNDVFEFAATTFGSLDGGIGIDALRVNSTSVFQISFENATLSGLEELVFDNISGTTAVEMDAAQVGGTGIATVWGSDAINQFTVQSSAASGYVANIDQILFQNWNRNFDTLGLLGTTGDDTLIGTSYRTNIVLSDGADTIISGDDDDTFSINNNITVAGFNWSGGGGDDTMRININVTGYVTLAAGTITGIEKLDFGSSEAVVALDSSAFASVDGFQIINGGATNKFNSLVILGAEVDLSAVSLVNWTTSEVITYDGTAGDDQLTGSSVTDAFFGTVGADTIDGGDGIDSINYDQSTSGVTVSLAAGTGSGGHSDGDVLSNIENLTGSSHDDRLTGESGDNYLVGGGGNDRFVGGNGQDRYTGGTGDDIFVFSNVNHSRVGDNIRDQIDDFSQLPGDDDQIDVNNIDAQVTSTATNEAFTFIGTAAFSGEGQIRVVQSGNDTVVEFNTTGNDSAEMEILLLGFTATNVSAGDFVL